MLYRLKVVPDSVDSKTRSFQARGGTPEIPEEEAERLAEDLEAGAIARFYREGRPWAASWPPGPPRTGSGSACA